MANFALIGAAGYIAPRHMKAIKDTGNVLVSALDSHDAVGVLDKYFFDVDFFTEFERFERLAEKLRRQPEEKRIHYVSICSPNYLHDSHARFALRIGAHAICEKPLVVNPWNLDALQELEQETGKKVFTVLQLRTHPAIAGLHEAVAKEQASAKRDVVLTYITSRGRWYLRSWKGIPEKSGGLVTNIGVHFFDMLLWIFGNVRLSEVHLAETTRASGYLELDNARVRWFLSIDPRDLPKEAVEKNQTTHRSITVDGKELEFSEGFTDLHTEVYRRTLAGQGFTIEDARPSINLTHGIRHSVAMGVRDSSHPFVARKAGR